MFDRIPDVSPEVFRAMQRRKFLRTAAAGTVITALGAWWVLADDEATARAREQSLPDGRPRLPPGQKVITRLKPMGGLRGDPSRSAFRLHVHGAVEKPFVLDFEQLLALPQVERELDVHCVTGWSVLGASWQGVTLRTLAEKAGLKAEASHVIFESARGYTANVPLADALAPDVMVAHRHLGQPLATRNGAPVRALVPNLYFWKSAKWLTGIRFETRSISGYWEIRGYHDRGDPWLEQRYG